MSINRWVAPLRGIQGGKHMNKLGSMAAMVVAAVALAGCGGGGSSSLGLSGGGSGSGGGGGGGGSGSGGTKTYSMGNGSGSAFQSGMISIASNSLAAGGTTSLQVSIVDQTGAYYTGSSVTVTFSSTCISQGLAKVTATGSSSPGANPNTVITTTGAVDATYTAEGCSGSDVITASAAVASTNLTATGTLSVAAASTGSIQFKSAQPSTIGLKGTGQQSTSTVVFEVLDSTGAPKQGVTVNFAMDTTVGGLSLSPASAVSGADGLVQTIVSSGTVHTPVTVTASIASPAMSTRSSVLTVTTGIPASNTFSIAVGAAQYGANYQIGNSVPACPNIEGWGIDGINVPVTVSLADRYSNPVLDGTAVSFYADGGKIVGSCNTGNGTGNTGPGTGACAVNWTSENPRPTPTSSEPSTSKLPGRVVILATAIGEESFDDANANGFWDPGETFQDLGEPYDDSNESNAYDPGEYFLDYNKNGTRDAPSGSFVGITCTGTSPGSTCTSNTLAIGVQHLIIMSTGGANISCASTAGFTGTCSGGLTIGYGATGTIVFNLQDGNGNPIPAGSSVSVTSVNVGNINSAAASFSEGCSTNVGGDDYSATLTAAAAPNPAAPISGSITIQVTSIATHTVSSYTIPVTVN